MIASESTFQINSGPSSGLSSQPPSGGVSSVFNAKINIPDPVSVSDPERFLGPMDPVDPTDPYAAQSPIVTAAAPAVTAAGSWWLSWLEKLGLGSADSSSDSGSDSVSATAANASKYLVLAGLAGLLYWQFK